MFFTKFFLKLSLSLVILALITFSCNLKEPVLPSWETVVRLPLVVEKIYVGDEITAADSISTITFQSFNGRDSVLFISIDDTAQLREISAGDLSVQPRGSNASLTIGTLQIASYNDIETPNITLADLFPDDSVLIGQQVVIPPITLEGLSYDLDTQDFEQIHFLSGQVRLRITNNLPFALGPDLEVRVINLNDSLSGEFALTFPDPVTAGATATAEGSLADTWLVSPLRLQMRIPIAGAVIDSLTSTLFYNAGFQVALELEDIEADEVVAILEPQRFRSRIILGYEDQTRLRSAIIDGGTITINFENEMPLDAGVEVVLPAILTAQSDTFRQEVLLPSRQTTPIELSFDGNEHQIRNPDHPGDLLDSLEIMLNVETLSSGSNRVHIRSTDGIALDITSTTLQFRSFSGVLGGDTLTISPLLKRSVADYENFEGGVELSEAELRMILFGDFNFDDLYAEVDITAYHEDDNGVITDSASLTISEQVFLGGNSNEIVLNGAPIVNLLNILPTTLKFEGRLIFAGEAEIERGDKIWVDYDFETPFRFRIDGLAKVEGEPSLLADEDISDIIQDAAEDNIRSGELTFILENRLPVGGILRFILSADTADPYLYDTPRDTNLVIEREVLIQAAPTDPASGFVTGFSLNEVNYTLNRREIRLFKDPPLVFGYQLRLSDTDGFVTVHYSDNLEMLGRGNFTILIEDN